MKMKLKIVTLFIGVLFATTALISCKDNVRENTEPLTKRNGANEVTSNTNSAKTEMLSEGKLVNIETPILDEKMVVKELMELEMNEEEIVAFKAKMINNTDAKTVDEALNTIATKAKTVIKEAKNEAVKTTIVETASPLKMAEVKEKIEVIQKTEVTEIVKDKVAQVAENVAIKEEPVVVEEPKVTINEKTRNFVNKDYKISGNWSLGQEGDKVYIVLHSNFKTKKGPDLKVFLNKQDLSSVTGKNALNSSVLVSKLKSNKGEQKYLVPSHIDMSQFKSMLIHCEKYAVLWGGGSL